MENLCPTDLALTAESVSLQAKTAAMTAEAAEMPIDAMIQGALHPDDGETPYPRFRRVDTGRLYEKPTRKRMGDAGYDLVSPIDTVLNPFECRQVYTNAACELPPGWFAMIQERSSQGKVGVMTLGNVIDEGYNGELSVVLLNTTKHLVIIHQGDRIAQLVLIPRYIDPREHLLPERGTKGFGSTGR